MTSESPIYLIVIDSAHNKTRRIIMNEQIPQTPPAPLTPEEEKQWAMSGQ
jgi:hypothetical protein